MNARVRPIGVEDWPRIAALEAEAYRGYGLSEGLPALRSRAGVAAGTSFVVDLGGEVAGYLLALPYPQRSWPDLTRPETVVHESANLHLHDLVIATHRRRSRLGVLLLGHLLAAARARGYERVSLVCVAGSDGFWLAQGFRPHHDVAAPSGYGPAATYMSRPVDKET